MKDEKQTWKCPINSAYQQYYIFCTHLKSICRYLQYYPAEWKLKGSAFSHNSFPWDLHFNSFFWHSFSSQRSTHKLYLLSLDSKLCCDLLLWYSTFFCQKAFSLLVVKNKKFAYFFILLGITTFHLLILLIKKYINLPFSYLLVVLLL